MINRGKKIETRIILVAILIDLVIHLSFFIFLVFFIF